MSTPVYMHTLGCPKNRVDSEVMLGTLSQAGYRLVQDPARADVIVVNTCGFIESAKEESIQAILDLAGMKEEGRCKKLVVAGCLTQRYPDEMAREIPEVDHFVGTGAYQDIASIISDAQSKRVIVPDPDFLHAATTPRVNSLASHTAYLKIAEGCDNACAFCIIPKLRGAQRSRTVADVVAEAEGIARATQIIQQRLTPLYIQHEAIEAQKAMVGSPNHSVIYIPVGPMGVPIVNVAPSPGNTAPAAPAAQAPAAKR